MPLYGPQCMDIDSDDASSSAGDTVASTPSSPAGIRKRPSDFSSQAHLTVQDRGRGKANSRTGSTYLSSRTNGPRIARDPDIWPDGTTSRTIPGKRYVAAYVDIVIPKKRRAPTASSSSAAGASKTHKVRFADATSEAASIKQLSSNKTGARLKPAPRREPPNAIHTPTTRTLFSEPPPLYHSNTDSPSDTGTSSSLDSNSPYNTPNIPSLRLAMPSFPFLPLLKPIASGMPLVASLPYPPLSSTGSPLTHTHPLNPFLIMYNLYHPYAISSIPPTDGAEADTNEMPQCANDIEPGTEEERLEVTKRAILAALSVLPQPPLR